MWCADMSVRPSRSIYSFPHLSVRPSVSSLCERRPSPQPPRQPRPPPRNGHHGSVGVCGCVHTPAPTISRHLRRHHAHPLAVLLRAVLRALPLPSQRVVSPSFRRWPARQHRDAGAPPRPLLCCTVGRASALDSIHSCMDLRGDRINCSEAAPAAVARRRVHHGRHAHGHAATRITQGTRAAAADSGIVLSAPVSPAAFPAAFPAAVPASILAPLHAPRAGSAATALLRLLLFAFALAAASSSVSRSRAIRSTQARSFTPHPLCVTASLLAAAPRGARLRVSNRRDQYRRTG